MSIGSALGWISASMDYSIKVSATVSNEFGIAREFNKKKKKKKLLLSHPDIRKEGPRIIYSKD